MALRLRCFREFAGSPFQRELNVLQTELLNLLCHAFCSTAEAWDTAPLTSCSCCQTRILCEHQRSSDTAFVNLGGGAPPARPFNIYAPWPGAPCLPAHRACASVLAFRLARTALAAAGTGTARRLKLWMQLPAIFRSGDFYRARLQTRILSNRT